MYVEGIDVCLQGRNELLCFNSGRLQEKRDSERLGRLKLRLLKWLIFRDGGQLLFRAKECRDFITQRLTETIFNYSLKRAKIVRVRLEDNVPAGNEGLHFFQAKT